MVLLFFSGCLGRIVFEKEYNNSCVNDEICSPSEEPPLIHVENPCQGIYEGALHFVTWNIEWFPKHEAHTLNYVSAIITQLDVDVLAIQELDNRAEFDELLESLPGYSGYYESAWFAGLAYIYKTETIDIQDIYEIYTTEPYWSAFPRSPMVMDMVAGNERYILINNHLKCCGDGRLDMGDLYDEERRRYDAINYLVEYIEAHFSDDKVFVMGDLNDNIAEPEPNNIFNSPLQAPEEYRFVDMGIARGSPEQWSFPSWPSHLDHIFVTDEVFPQLDTAKVYTLKLDQLLRGGWPEYNAKISDHRPVGICIGSSNEL